MKLIDVSVSFKKKEVLKQVNLDLSKPGIYGVLGANGVGKTTLFKVMTGRLLIKGEMIKQGWVSYIKGKENNVTLQFQQLLSLSGRFNEGYCYQLMHYFNLEWDKKKRLNQTEEAILLVCMTLSIDAEYYLFDEPFNDVDEQTRIKMIQLFIQTSEHKKVLISSHIIDDLEQCLDYLVLFTMSEGIKMFPIEALRCMVFNTSKENAIGSISRLNQRLYLHETKEEQAMISLKDCYDAIVEGV